MSSNREITLYDLPSRPPNACWSLNPWKARLALNYKNLPYSTTWLEYPSIEPTFASLGIPPNDPSVNPIPYTIPAVRLPDGRYTMDSLKIVEEIERLRPHEKPLHLDAPVLGEVLGLVAQVMGAMRGIGMPGVPANLLNSSSREYFERTREEKFGMPLSELARKEGGDQAYEKARPSLRKLGELLEKEGAGPFFLGTEVSFADFVVVSALEFKRRIDGEIYERVVGMEPGLGRLYEACKPWLERNDH